MIPAPIERYIDTLFGETKRVDRASAIAMLHDLGVPLDSEFSEFYIKYKTSCLITPKPLSELLDITGLALPAIPDQTEYVYDRYEISEKYLALTSDEGEGMYLYNKDDRGVYDLYVRDIDEFIEGKTPARWSSFYEFLMWYFDLVE